MAENIFSLEYEKYLDELKKARQLAIQKPTPENVKNYHTLNTQEWSVESRFTESYLQTYLKEKEKRQMSFEDEFNWLWRSMTIDMKANSEQISEITRAEMHRKNDKQHNNNRYGNT